jgi:hypothetical protein
MRMFLSYMAIISLVVFIAYGYVQVEKAQLSEERDEVFAEAERIKRESPVTNEPTKEVEQTATTPAITPPIVEQPKLEPVKQEVQPVNNVANNYYVDNSTTVNYIAQQPVREEVHTDRDDHAYQAENEDNEEDENTHGGDYDRMDNRGYYGQPPVRVLARRMEWTPEGYRRGFYPSNAIRRYQAMGGGYGRLRGRR